MDQIFSRISPALSKHPAMTFMELARIVRNFSPSNNVHQLERTWNVHPWLIGDEDCPVIATFWGDITDGQQLLIERCSHDMSGNPISSGVSLQVAEYSSRHYGLKMYPLQNLPKGRPEYNASRPIFSRWEKDSNGRDTGNRTSPEQAMAQFDKSRTMICDPEGPIISQLRYENCLPCYCTSKLCIIYMIV